MTKENSGVRRSARIASKSKSGLNKPSNNVGSNSKKRTSRIQLSQNTKKKPSKSTSKAINEHNETTKGTNRDNDGHKGNEKLQCVDPAKVRPRASNSTEHLVWELQDCIKQEKLGFRVETVDDNLFTWHVYFTYDKENKESAVFCKDLLKYSKATGREPAVKMEVVFPQTYPDLPPFVRLLYPRLKQWTGHVTIGGSICVEDLTRSGWKSANQLVPLFVSLRQLLLDGKARVETGQMQYDYQQFEAQSAFQRVAKFHGWKI